MAIGVSVTYLFFFLVGLDWIGFCSFLGIENIIKQKKEKGLMENLGLFSGKKGKTTYINLFIELCLNRFYTGDIIAGSFIGKKNMKTILIDLPFQMSRFRKRF